MNEIGGHQSTTERKRLEGFVETLAATPRGHEEPLATALARGRRRALGAAAVLGLGVVALVVMWNEGSILGPGAGDSLVSTFGVLLAAVWVGYRLAEWRWLGRLERRLGRPAEHDGDDEET